LFHKLLLYTHILSAVASIGPFFVLIPTVKKLLVAELSVERAYLDTFRVAVGWAKHAGHVLVLSGIALAIVGYWPWNSSWIVMTVLILLSSLFFLARAFSPTLRKFNEPGHDKEDLVRTLSRSLWIYLALLMAMLWFMVAKPVLW
jgi:uncharacterized membrane protein